MRQEIEEWARSTGSPTMLATLAIGTIVAPLALETVSAVADGVTGTREWDDRLFDRVTGPFGGTILSVVVLIVAYKLLTLAFNFIMDESRKKDETIKTLIEQRGKD